MRIPLDYYRILGLPIQATAEQLQQAHRDRTLQLPRREFSEAAIDARRQLIDEAYAVLSDSIHRQEYDASFLAKSYELLEVGKSSDAPGFSGQIDRGSADLEDIDPYSPNVEIADNQLVGALLILLELGEYELVLKLGRPYLSSSNPALRQGRFGDPEIVAADIVLTVTLACLELGREQWQQGQYENAATSLQMGQEILLQEGYFPVLRGEMQADLYKLRPYRILELVALPETQAESRQAGISLLEDMLQDRGGIDGSGDDQSGLSVDDFLRFIQQLRSYLTASEQQALFEAESRRPSAVAIYLAVYALLARGFAERQPALIRRAKGMLLRLGTRQDVHLEQAVCSLLLGQTDEASRALELSREFESLAFIREHSQGSPDLLPGLCLYSERWLQNEVFPYFRNLARKQASLKEYFADEGVQAYLEELPNEPEPVPARSISRPPTRSSPFESRPQPEPRFQTPIRAPEPSFASSPSATAIIDAPEQLDAEFPAAERMSQPPGEGEDRNGSQPIATTGTSVRQPARRNGGAPARRSGNGRNVKLNRLLLLAGLGILGVLLLGFLLNRLFGQRPAPVANSPVANETVAGGTGLQVQPLSPALSEAIGQQGQSVGAEEPLDETNAATVIEAWLAAKAAAMGENHNIAELSDILTDPALSSWRERAEEVQRSNSYWVYEHSDVQVDSVEMLSDDGTVVEADADAADADATDPDATDPDATDPDAEATDSQDATTASATPKEAIVEASVTEKGEFYSNGQLDPSSSYDSTLQVRYNLIQDGGEWRIQSSEVLE